MSTLIVVAYEDKHRASDVLSSLRRLERDDLSDLDDAVAVCRQDDGGIEFELMVAYARASLPWETLIGSLLGAAPAGSLELGPDFLHQLRDTLTAGTSAVVAWVRDGVPDHVAGKLAQHGGTTIRTTLTADQEVCLRRS